ncbi:MAG TPA: hypothetical protein VFC24_18815 [Casimicrobiaceae bacterium]|nr:hypothetical protein [Casimicrobiaceae bacterium]
MVEFVLDRPFVREFNDRTKSRRPPREALTPPSPGPFLSRLILLPTAEDLRICSETLPVLAFWGD